MMTAITVVSVECPTRNQARCYLSYEKGILLRRFGCAIHVDMSTRTKNDKTITIVESNPCKITVGSIDEA